MAAMTSPARPHSSSLRSRNARSAAIAIAAVLTWAAVACAPTQTEAPSAAPGAATAPEPQPSATQAPGDEDAGRRTLMDAATDTPATGLATASGTIEEGMASWYGPNFVGRPTANGEVFDPSQLTAAHRTLPFDTRVRVTNLENGRSVVVRINDRGPFKDNRVIDLSQAAAREVGLMGSGVAPVRIDLASQGPGQRTVAEDPRLTGYDVIVPGLPAGTLLVLRGPAQAEAVVRVVAAPAPTTEGLDGTEVFAAPALAERFGPVVELAGL